LSSIPGPDFALLYTALTSQHRQSLLSGTCQNDITQSSTRIAVQPARHFSQTALCRGKNSKAKKEKGTPTTSVEESTESHDAEEAHDPNRPQPDPENPYDFTDLLWQWDRVGERWIKELNEVAQGPRADADHIGKVRCLMDRKTGEERQIRELATVAPIGGRRWSILVYEEAYVKPILSGIQNSTKFNQQPQRNPENPLEMTLTMDPESPGEQTKRVKAMCQTWRELVRPKTRKRLTLFGQWQKSNLITKDDLAKLKEKTQKLQDDVMKKIAQKEKEVLASVERASGR